MTRCSADPAVDALSSYMGGGVMSTGNLWVGLKPLDATRCPGRGGDRPPAHPVAQDRRHPRLPAAGAGFECRPGQHIGALSVSRDRHRRCGRGQSRRGVAPAHDPSARTDGCHHQHRHARRPGSRPCRRSGAGRALRHHAAGGRQHALRRVRPAPDRADLSAAELSRKW